MAAPDQIAGKQAPNGEIVGVLVTGGDMYFINDSNGNPRGPVFRAQDPNTLLFRYFRQNVILQSDGEGGSYPVAQFEEVFLA